MEEKKIRLTRDEWVILKDLIRIAVRGEDRLGIPLVIKNGDQEIAISEDKVKISLFT